MADTTNTTTVHTAEVVRYDDPVIITERVAVAAFIAGQRPDPPQLRHRAVGWIAIALIGWSSGW
jgi:hypothetical protein